MGSVLRRPGVRTGKTKIRGLPAARGRIRAQRKGLELGGQGMSGCIVHVSAWSGSAYEYSVAHARCECHRR